jgi:hypothetical protein
MFRNDRRLFAVRDVNDHPAERLLSERQGNDQRRLEDCRCRNNAVKETLSRKIADEPWLAGGAQGRQRRSPGCPLRGIQWIASGRDDFAFFHARSPRLKQEQGTVGSIASGESRGAIQAGAAPSPNRLAKSSINVSNVAISGWGAFRLMKE